jgi:hypothetical protein
MRLVSLLSTAGSAEARRHSASALWQLSNNADSKQAIVASGGIEPFVALLADQAADPWAHESAAAVLSELARSQQQNKHAIVEAGGLKPLVLAVRGASAEARKHATCCLWALTSGASSEKTIDKARVDAALPALALSQAIPFYMHATWPDHAHYHAHLHAGLTAAWLPWRVAASRGGRRRAARRAARRPVSRQFATYQARS